MPVVLLRKRIKPADGGIATALRVGIERGLTYGHVPRPYRIKFERVTACGGVKSFPSCCELNGPIPTAVLKSPSVLLDSVS